MTNNASLDKAMKDCDHLIKETNPDAFAKTLASATPENAEDPLRTQLLQFLCKEYREQVSEVVQYVHDVAVLAAEKQKSEAKLPADARMLSDEFCSDVVDLLSGQAKASGNSEDYDRALNRDRYNNLELRLRDVMLDSHAVAVTIQEFLEKHTSTLNTLHVASSGFPPN